MSDKKYAWVRDALSHVPLTTKARALKHFLMGKNEYLPAKKTRADMDEVIKCALCPNMCKFDCPVLAAAATDAVSPSGKARLAYFLETEALATDDAALLMYACCSCDACREWCPFDFSVADILQGVRADLVDRHREPEAARETRQRLEEQHSLHQRQVEPAGPPTGDLLYFMGCEVSARHPEIARDTRTVLEAAGVTPAMLPQEWCCGAPLLSMGYVDDFLDVARHQARAVESSRCSTVVCSCPTCTYMLRVMYPRHGISLPAQVLHSSEYLARLVQEERLPAGAVDGPCVYHDPCTLARKLGVMDPPRQVLHRMGMDVRESPFNREHTQCCGRGGSLPSFFPKVADAITEARLQELHRTAPCIVTACPTCKSAFSGQGAEAYDLVQVVRRALEEA